MIIGDLNLVIIINCVIYIIKDSYYFKGIVIFIGMWVICNN